MTGRVATLSRRLFLAASASFLATGAMASMARPGQIAFVNRWMRRVLPDLIIDDAQLDQFASDFLDVFQAPNPDGRRRIVTAARVVAPLSPTHRAWVLPKKYEDQIAWFERQLLQQFLLGTDYFESRQVPNKSTHYFQLPDPYVIGCANPIAQFDMV